MQINIQDIIPYLKSGYLAMDRNGDWYWYEKEPYINQYHWESKGACESFKDFGCLKDVDPADDWEKSLIKIDNTAREKFKEEYQNNIQKTIQELKQND